MNKKDICHTSLDILNERVSPVIRSLVGTSQRQTTWFPDIDVSFTEIEQSTPAVIDCVLTGNFLKRILESNRWPKKDFRLWVLSQRSKDVLVNLGSFKNEEIQVIPRSFVFDYDHQMKQINLNKKINLVFAGRISPTKNIESILLSTYFLQKKYRLNCQLHLVGPTDNIPHPESGRFNYDDYFQGIKELSDSLSWQSPPVFYPKTNSEDWLNLDIENKILVNHSTYICEDFNVSLAQAQSRGWPSIISSFGGNTDVVLPNSVVIPWLMVARSDENLNLIRIKSEIVADYVFQSLSKTAAEPIPGKEEKDVTSVKIPKILPLETILENRTLLLGVFNFPLVKVLPNDLVDLATTAHGINFFSYYKSFFGKVDFTDSVAIIVNDLNSDPSPQKAKVKNQILEWTEILRGQKIFLISILDLGSPSSRFVLAGVKKVCFPFSGPIYAPYISFIKAVVAADCQFVAIGDA